MAKNILLSICIPTYNRAEQLKKNLCIIVEAINDIDVVEIYISDNSSTDNTEDIVAGFMDKTSVIRYHKNTHNIGPDRNFLQCFNEARGKYIWLLGDDDFLCDYSIKSIINVLDGGDYGLVHLRYINKTKEPIIYRDKQKFLSDVDFMITFMSANIISAKYVANVEVTDFLLSCNLLQMMFYIEAAISSKENVILNCNVFLEPENDNNNGNYNFFKVFISNYLSVWRHFKNRGYISGSTYKIIKRKVFRSLVLNHIVKILILKQMPKMETEDAWPIILKNYGHEPYFYYYAPKIIYYILKQIKG